MCDAHFEHPCRAVGSDQHGQLVELEDANRIAIGVHDLLVCNPVLASTVQDNRVHRIKLH
jgi:hypothetical protein